MDNAYNQDVRVHCTPNRRLGRRSGSSQHHHSQTANSDIALTLASQFFQDRIPALLCMLPVRHHHSHAT
jgi:hypothetical protein